MSRENAARFATISIRTLDRMRKEPGDPSCLKRYLAREVFRRLTADLRALHGT